jgi:putative endonuclease
MDTAPALTRRARGDEGEQLVAEHLERQGFEVLSRNAHFRDGELDIVARRGEVLAFVEVRSRATAALACPLETVGPAKQRKVVRAAMRYLARHRLWQHAVRFDVAAVVGRGTAAQLTYVEAAFEAGF